MNELLKAYINSGVRIPLKQLKLLTRADIKSYLKRRYFTFIHEDFGFDNALDIDQVYDSQAVIAYEYDLFHEFWVDDEDLIKKALEIDGTNIHYVGVHNVDIDTLLIAYKSRPRIINDLSEKRINDLIYHAIKLNPVNIINMWRIYETNKHIKKHHIEKAVELLKNHPNSEMQRRNMIRLLNYYQ